MPAASFAGTSFGADRDDLNSTRKAPSDARGCRRDIRSNGWIELRKGALAPFEADPAEEADFSSIGADGISVRNFTGSFARWDLVLTCSPTPSLPPGAVEPGIAFPEQHYRLIRIALAGMASSRTWRRSHVPDARDDAMVIALPKPLGKRFVALALSAGRGILFQIARLDAPPLHLRRVHRDA